MLPTRSASTCLPPPHRCFVGAQSTSELLPRDPVDLSVVADPLSQRCRLGERVVPEEGDHSVRMEGL